MGRSKKKCGMKILLLSIIIRHEKIHGYKIYKELLDIGMDEWNPSIGTLYRLLNELTGKGYIVAEEGYAGKRRIVYYMPTKKGIEEFLHVCEHFFEDGRIGMEILLPTLKKLKARNMVDPYIDGKARYLIKLLSDYLNSSE